MTDATGSTLELVARGILAADALSWPNAAYRIRLLNPKRLARMEVLAAFAREHATTTPAVPYAHSSPVEILQPGPGEPSEWFAFAADAFRRCRAESSLSPLADAWRRAARSEGSAVRIGTRVALRNIRDGLVAPQSGNDNPHYFDDLPLVRSVAAAVVFDEAETAIAAAREDAGYTGGRDGVWCAAATASLFFDLLRGRSTDDAVSAALQQLPAETWSRRLAETALSITAQAGTPLQRAHLLSAEIGDWIYSYSSVAPETFAFLIAHASRADTADDLLLGVLAQPRNAPTLPALAGALASILFGTDWMPAGLNLESRYGGVGVRELAGRSVGESLAPNGAP